LAYNSSFSSALEEVPVDGGDEVAAGDEAGDKLRWTVDDGG